MPLDPFPLFCAISCPFVSLSIHCLTFLFHLTSALKKVIFLLNSPLLCFSSSLQLQLTLISACLHFFSSPCITVYLSASLTSRFFLFTFFPLLNLSMSHSDIVLNWQFLFSLAANSINKMPSPQLSFPITAPLLVRMRVGPRLLKVFLCAGC